MSGGVGADRATSQATRCHMRANSWIVVAGLMLFLELSFFFRNAGALRGFDAELPKAMVLCCLVRYFSDDGHLGLPGMHPMLCGCLAA